MGAVAIQVLWRRHEMKIYYDGEGVKHILIDKVFNTHLKRGNG